MLVGVRSILCVYLLGVDLSLPVPLQQKER